MICLGFNIYMVTAKIEFLYLFKSCVGHAIVYLRPLYFITVPKSQTIVITLQSAALKEAIDDLEWPGSSIQIKLQPTPPSVTFRGEGHGDLQV